MVTREGHAKVLDFGLAKLVETGKAGASLQSGGGASEVATALMQQHSTPGAILGTVGYMSPEQAQGHINEIDQRSDIFSFGCILYEPLPAGSPSKEKTQSIRLIRSFANRRRPSAISTRVRRPTCKELFAVAWRKTPRNGIRQLKTSRLKSRKSGGNCRAVLLSIRRSRHRLRPLTNRSVPPQFKVKLHIAACHLRQFLDLHRARNTSSAALRDTRQQRSLRSRYSPSRWRASATASTD